MDYVIANDFKNIFKHDGKPSDPWRAYLRAFMVIFQKKVKVKFWVSGGIWKKFLAQKHIQGKKSQKVDQSVERLNFKKLSISCNIIWLVRRMTPIFLLM